MSDVFLLTPTQSNRIKPYLSASHGVPRVGDLRVMSRIFSMIRHGLH